MFGINLYAILVSLVLIGGIGAGGYFYYKDAEATKLRLQTQAALLEAAILEKDKIISILQEEAVTNEENYTALVYRNRVAEEYQEKLLDILHKHDLTNLASKKPGLIETRINEGTQNVLNSLERTTSDDTGQ